MLHPGTDLLIYTTRGCFNNPRRDRGRVMGLARVTSPVAVADPPIEINGRPFAVACDIELRWLAPNGCGLDLAELVDQLQVFPDKRSWSAWLRRPLLALPDEDAALLVDGLRHVAGPPSDAIGTY